MATTIYYEVIDRSKDSLIESEEITFDIEQSEDEAVLIAQGRLFSKGYSIHDADKVFQVFIKGKIVWTTT